MKPIHIAASLILLLSSSTFAPAMDLSGDSRSYLQYRQDFDGTRELPLYEYLDLQTTNIGDESVSFQFGGWYRYDLKNVPDQDSTAGDLQYAYLDLHAKRGNTFLRLGRVLVNEGVCNEQVDGAYARTDLRGGFTVAAYGGLPVETDWDSRTGDSVYGGRVSQGLPGIYTLGVSFVMEQDNSTDFRKEGGIDVWVQPFSKLTVQGMSSYNFLSSGPFNALSSGPTTTLDRGWMQHQYYLLLGPFGDLRLTGEYSKVYYQRYFWATNLSAFTFPNIDPNETVTTIGGSADYSINQSFTIGADYKNFDYDLANNSAKYYGGRLTYAATGLGAGLAVHRMDGPTDSLQYDDLRVYVTKKIQKVDITLDFLWVHYQQAINGVDNAYTGVAAAGLMLSPKAKIVADVEYSKNPDFDKDVRGMLTLVYSFDVSTAKKSAGAAGRSDSALASRYRSTPSGGAADATRLAGL